MNYARICYLLISLLVFQTAVAFYDSHEELQNIATHLPPHHQDGQQGVDFPQELTDSKVKSGSASHPNGPDFCHHCCHCHGIGVIGILGQITRFVVIRSISLREVINLSFPSGYFSALFRPPKA
ncbi:hypothetical protein [Microbulbifer sp. HZ11]|uniref:hypothetical protein n=1 Tax=Microbulbifer sp. HZ11 TaxID=1453501 RepID=UPI0012DC23A8|nr:hypothetical protein [Microbulbifer sp. HZ11]